MPTELLCMTQTRCMHTYLDISHTNNHTDHCAPYNFSAPVVLPGPVFTYTWRQQDKEVTYKIAATNWHLLNPFQGISLSLDQTHTGSNPLQGISLSLDQTTHRF